MSNPSNLGEETPSFANLVQREVVEPSDLLACMADYALSGWAISSSAVVAVAEKANLATPDLEALRELAQSGIERQLAGGRFTSSQVTRDSEAGQYQIVEDYAARQLAQAAQFN